LELGVIDSLSADHGVELVPLEKGTLHFFNLRDQGLLDETFEDLDDFLFVLHGSSIVFRFETFINKNMATINQ
jgi:hypothetical protein